MNYNYNKRSLVSMITRKTLKTTKNKKIMSDELVGRRWHAGLNWAERQCRDGHFEIVEEMVAMHRQQFNPYFAAAGCYVAYVKNNPHLLDYTL